MRVCIAGRIKHCPLAGFQQKAAYRKSCQAMDANCCHAWHLPHQRKQLRGMLEDNPSSYSYVVTYSFLFHNTDKKEKINR